jgi:hypothetical protein
MPAARRRLGIAAHAESEHVHAERTAERGDAAADRAHAENTQGFAVQLCQHVARPLAGPHVAIDASELARHREHQRKRVLRHRDGVDAGRIAHRDAASSRRFEVDVIRAGAPDGDHLQSWTRREDLVGKTRIGADIDRDARIPDAPDEFGLVFGAAFGMDAHFPQPLRALVGAGALEHRREIVRNNDQVALPALVVPKARYRPSASS